jgi:hypothetical protein
MKYNYKVSIFLLIFVIIISQSIYVYTNNKKIIDGFCGGKCRRLRRERRRRNAQAVIDNRKMIKLLKVYSNSRQTPYVNLLAQGIADENTQIKIIAYNEAIQIDALASKTNPCNSDKDISEILMLTSRILSGDGQNSTKVYFISEVIFKGLGHFYDYNIKSIESQNNYLIYQFPKTFNDDETVRSKYYKFMSLLALSYISKSTTSTSLRPSSNHFLKISSPIISECKKIINELNTIKYDLSIEEKEEIQNKYKIIVK